jgi:soluble lytic murein transglycosylase-like protein
MRLLFVSVVIVLWGWQPYSWAASIYVCEDKGGGQRFTNTPDSASCRVFSKKRSSPFPSSGRYTKNRRESFGASRYDSQIVYYGKRYNVDPSLIKAVIRTESSFNRYAVSKRGAQGLMQLMPGTAQDLNIIDPFNPNQNIEGGTRYLRSLLDTFDGDLPKTLAAYNAGPSLVKRVNRVPKIPETVRYVKKVLAYYKGYKGSGAINSLQRSMINMRGLITIQ